METKTNINQPEVNIEEVKKLINEIEQPKDSALLEAEKRAKARRQLLASQDENMKTDINEWLKGYNIKDESDSEDAKSEASSTKKKEGVESKIDELGEKVDEMNSSLEKMMLSLEKIVEIQTKFYKMVKTHYNE